MRRKRKKSNILRILAAMILSSVLVFPQPAFAGSMPYEDPYAAAETETGPYEPDNGVDPPRDENVPDGSGTDSQTPDGYAPGGSGSNGGGTDVPDANGTVPEGSDADTAAWDVPGPDSSGTDAARTDRPETNLNESDGYLPDDHAPDGYDLESGGTDGPGADGANSRRPGADGSVAGGPDADGSEADGPVADGSGLKGPGKYGSESDGSGAGGPDSDGSGADSTDSDVPGADADGSASDGTASGGTGSETSDTLLAEIPVHEDLSSLSAYDFSSMRLIVSGNIIDPSNVISEYDGVYLLQYHTEEDAKNAFLYYRENAEFAEVDTVIYAADDTFSYADAPETSDASEVPDAAAALDAPGASDASDAQKSGDPSPMDADNNPLNALALLEENDTAEKAPGAGHEKVIALIDTGVTHPGVSSSVSVIGDDTLDDNGHGTAMAEYIFDEDPNACILSIKALGSDGSGDVSAVYAAIRYAIDRKVSVINLSMSAVRRPEHASLESVIREAAEAGITVVASAGNNGKDARFFVPGCIPESLTVGSCDENGVKLPDSNFGRTVDAYFVSGSTSEAAARYSAVFNSGKSQEKVFLPENIRYPENAADTSDPEDIENDSSGLSGKLMVSSINSNTVRNGITVTPMDFNRALNQVAGINLFIPPSSPASSVIASSLPAGFKWDGTYLYYNGTFNKNTTTSLGSPSIVLKNWAYDINGNKYDVRITLNNITVKTANTSNTPVFKSICLMSATANSVVLRNLGYTEADMSGPTSKSSFMGHRERVTIEILNAAGNKVNGMKTAMSFRDLDAIDYISDMDGNGSRDYAASANTHVYNNATVYPYAEAITIPAKCVVSSASGSSVKPVYVYTDNYIFAEAVNSLEGSPGARFTSTETTGGDTGRPSTASSILFSATSTDLTLDWSGSGSCGTVLFETAVPKTVKTWIGNSAGNAANPAHGTITDGGKGAVSYPTHSTNMKYTAAADHGYVINEFGVRHKDSVNNTVWDTWQTLTDRSGLDSASFTISDLSADYEIYANFKSAPSITVKKVDENGNPLSGAVFQIQRNTADGQNWADYPNSQEALKTTGTDGKATFSVQPSANANQCKYRIYEKTTPYGYKHGADSGEWRYYTVNANGSVTQHKRAAAPNVYSGAVSTNNTWTNIPWSGSLTVTKEDLEGHKLSGAVFTMYRNTGTESSPVYTAVFDSKTTGSDGTASFEFKYDDSEGGMFAVKETQAPPDHELDDPAPRYFRLTGNNTVKQYSDAACTAQTASNTVWKNSPSNIELTVVKRVHKDDLHAEHGAPNFAFEISGTTLKGKDKETYPYHVQIDFSESAEISGDYYIKSKTITIPAGNYTVRELETDRYDLTDITVGAASQFTVTKANDGAPKNGIQPVKGYAKGRLTKNDSVTFTNRKTYWPNYSHTSSTENHFE